MGFLKHHGSGGSRLPDFKADGKGLTVKGFTGGVPGDSLVADSAILGHEAGRNQNQNGQGKELGKCSKHKRLGCSGSKVWGQENKVNSFGFFVNGKIQFYPKIRIVFYSSRELFE
jgi:hypothetical protein